MGYFDTVPKTRTLYSVRQKGSDSEIRMMLVSADNALRARQLASYVAKDAPHVFLTAGRSTVHTVGWTDKGEGVLLAVKQERFV